MNVIHSVLRPFQLLSFVVFLVVIPGACTTVKETPPPVTEVHVESKPLEYILVVSVEGVTKDQLYSEALAWFGETFRGPKNVIEVQDRQAGRIIAKPLFLYEPTVFESTARIRGVVRYSVKVEVKDGRYRYSIGDFFHEGSREGDLAPISFQLLTTDPECPYQFSPRDLKSSSKQETWDNLKLVAKNQAALIISSLKSRMAQAGTDKDNW